jgi:hypothetical protein
VFVVCRPINVVAISEIEFESRLGAVKGASHIASFYCPRFKRGEQGPTDPAKSCIWGNIIQGDVSRLGNPTNRKNRASFNRHKH